SHAGPMMTRHPGSPEHWSRSAGRFVVFLGVVFGLCWYAGIRFVDTLASLLEEGRFAHAGLLVLLNLGMAVALYAVLRCASRPIRLVFASFFVLGVLIDRLALETTDILPSAETVS